MTDLKSLTLPEMTAFLQSLGEPAFRGRQVFTWLHRGVTDFDGMTNLSKSLREKLKETCFITAPQVARKQVSRLDGTIKYLWELSDGNCIETVLMQYHHGNTVCISSQVGCRMGCAFCASTIAGKVRDLTPAEMLDQVLFTQIDAGLPISNIVLMGIGEPLDNYDNVRRFLTLVNRSEGVHIGMRHISLSTCGLAKGIDRLAEAGLFAGVLLMPVLPFLEDNVENLRAVVEAAAEAGARFVYPAFGMTLRDQQREYYYQALEKGFPGLAERYRRQYGPRYECPSPRAKALWAALEERCRALGLLCRMRDITAAYQRGYGERQLTFF